MLHALVERAGRTDFHDQASVEALRVEMVEAFAMLESHAHHEDLHVGGLLEQHAPAVFGELVVAHVEQTERMHALLARLAAAERSPRAAEIGHELVVALSRFAGELATHMADEEEIAMPALWAAMTDEEIAAAHHRLVSSIEPEVAFAFYRWMLPTMNTPERLGMLGAMRAGAPPEAFAAMVALATRVLQPADLAALEPVIGAVESHAA